MAQLSLATSTIGILDNQIDFTHYKLSKHLWKNQTEILNGIDDDANGFVDDVNGWSFINSSNQLFNFSLYGTFPTEVYKYYELRAKKSLGTITDEENEWYDIKRKDKEFKKIRKEFTSFTHGTHITCLAINGVETPQGINHEDIQFLPVQYLGDAESGAFKAPEFKPLEPQKRQRLSTNSQLKHLKKYVNSYIVWMIGKLEVSTDYMDQKVSVINGSWGMGQTTAEKIVDRIFEEQFGETKNELYEEEKKELSEFFIKTLIKKGTNILRKYNDILFVFSAGNKKEDTDTVLHYPSSILLPNVISVAASDRDRVKAYFSNFGAKTVSLFAPGVAVKSCTPENKSLPINGTSQAAPQVSSTAIKIVQLAKTLNIKTTPSIIKSLILGTTDKKDELINLSVSQGVLNPQRAFLATELLKDFSLDEAINKAKKEISDL